MPLLHKKPVELIRSEPPLPGASLSTADEDDHPAGPWRVRFTGETFYDYESYLERMDFYRQRQFSCAATGKTKLTFEEALVSEHNAHLKSGKFPEVFLEPLARFIHHRTSPLNSVVDEFLDLLNEIAYPNEKCEFRGSEATIQRHIPGSGKRNEWSVEIQLARPSGREEGTKIVDKNQITYANRNTSLIFYQSEFNNMISACDSRKDKAALNKPLLKAKIREIATKGTYASAPWIVNEPLLLKYSLPTELPLDLKLVEEKHARTQRRAKSNPAAAADAAAHDDDDSIVGGDGEDEENGPGADGGAVAKPGAAKGPVDDLKIEREGDAATAVPPPTASQFPAPQKCIGQLLMVWNFCSAFARTIGLSLFGFDDLATAIGTNRRNPLLDEIHVALIRTIFKGRARSNIRKTSLKVNTWPDLLMEYLEEEREEFGHPRLFHKFKYQAYWALTYEEKTALLAWLVNRAVESDAIRTEIEDTVDNIEELNKELREKSKAIRDKYKKMAEELRVNAKKAAAAAKAEETGAAPAEAPKTRATKQQEEENENGDDDDGADSDSNQVESSSESESEEEPPKTKAEIQERMERKLKRLQEEYDDLAKPPTIRVLPLGSDRYHNRYWWFGLRRVTAVDPKDRSHRGKRKTAPLSSAETRVFVEYYPGNVTIERPKAEKGRILRDERFDEYISSETDDDSVDNTKSPWATPSADMGPSSGAASSSATSKASAAHIRAERARRRRAAGLPSDSSSSSESDDSDDDGNDDSSSESEESSSSSSSSSLQARPTSRRARPQSLKDASSVSSSEHPSDFDEDDEEENQSDDEEEEDDAPRRSRRAAASKKTDDDDAMDVDEDESDGEYGRSSRRARARIVRPAAAKPSYNPRPVGSRASVRLVAKATLPGGSLSQQASRDAAVKQSKEEIEKYKREKAERKKQKKEEKAKRKQEKKEAKKRKREEAEKQAQEDAKKQNSAADDANDSPMPESKRTKTTEAPSNPAPSTEAKAAPVAASSSSSSKQNTKNNKKKATAAVSSTASNEEQDEDEDAEPVRKMPRWKPDLTQFNEQLMPKKVDHMWGFYDSMEQIEQLVEFLDPRGVRERLLKANLQKRLPRISHLMAKRTQQQRSVPVIPDGGRRSARTNSAGVPSLAASSGFLEPFDVYVNHLAKDK